MTVPPVPASAPAAARAAPTARPSPPARPSPAAGGDDPRSVVADYLAHLAVERGVAANTLA
ncbi:MAG TPA: hypothetical protein VF109_09225, partial [Mycobacteriales bacterium]